MYLNSLFLVALQPELLQPRGGFVFPDGGVIAQLQTVVLCVVLNLGSLLGEQDGGLAVQTLENMEHQFPAWKDFLGTVAHGLRPSITPPLTAS